MNKVYLTNRFHVAMRLFSNRSHMTSKCGQNVARFSPHFDIFCDLMIAAQVHSNMESICFIN